MNLNETHDSDLKSWVESANAPECPFPIQNLPFGVFSIEHLQQPHVGVAIGDYILDLTLIEQAGLLSLENKVFDQSKLNPFMALGKAAWSRVRRDVSNLLNIDNAVLRDDESLRSRVLVAQSEATMHLPFEVMEYTDFYASREHATNVGCMFRDPENALMPNWLHIPIGYNGRASTVVVSGTDIRRPVGQLKAPDAKAPIFAPSRKLDIELEIGAVVGYGNEMGSAITTSQANEMIFGYVLLNDWSARDVQVWEYQPLGPFQAKVFASTISPWVVTQEALEPFRVSGPTQDPEPLEYLQQNQAQNFDIKLSVELLPQGAEQSTVISNTNFRGMYWSCAQQLTHHASSGCAMRTGDLLGSGTISGPTPDSCGSMLEMTWNGRDPITLADGSERTFIEDNDTLILSGYSQAATYRVGFGQAVGKILPSKSN